MNNINPENNSINHWVSFKKGNEKSFKYLFNEYYPVLINYGHRFTSSKFIIEESVQDLFVKFWNNRVSLGVPADLKPYILKAFRSVIFRKIQNYSRRVGENPDPDHYKFNIEQPVEKQMISAEKEEELRKKVNKGLTSLTSRQREAIYLRFYEDMSYDEISDILEIEKGGAYKLIYRSLNRLKEVLGPILFLTLVLILDSVTVKVIR